MSQALVLLALAFTGLFSILALGAEAQPCTSLQHANEEEFTHTCVENFIYDPGKGNLIQDSELTTTFVQEYEGYGFDRDWIWFTERPEDKVAFDRSTAWAYCLDAADGRVAGEYCNAATGSSDLDFTFSGVGQVELSVITDGDAFIARACGNFSSKRPTDNPEVFLESFKFHDYDRDGVRDGDEPGLGGWQFDIVREESFIGQPNGSTGVQVESDANGWIRFELTSSDNLGPGVYRLEERQQTGWQDTTGDSLQFTLNFGDGGTTIRPGSFGNARTEADVLKVDFELGADFPTTIEARVPTALPIVATVANNGPAQRVTVTDFVRVTGGHVDGSDDCVFDVGEKSKSVTLERGATPKPLPFTFIVTCDKPSFHDFVFTDELLLVSDGVVDPNLDNNTRELTVTVPVEAETDLSVVAELDCPERTDVRTDTTCSVSIEASNVGFGPVQTQVDWSVSGLADCSVVPAGGSEVVELADGLTGTIAAEVVMNCADRSFHPFDLRASLAPVDIHVHDSDPSNDVGTSEDVVEVFEQADLSVVETDLWLSCDEYFAGDPFSCVAVVPITNLGTAPDVVTLTTVSLTGQDCVATPDPQTSVQTVDVGETVVMDFAWSVSCADPDAVHILYLDSCVANAPSDPHAKDLAGGNDCGRVAAVPIDFKALSDPNTYNPDRKGTASVAILSGPTFNPVDEVDTSRPITFGPTGTEATATRCSTDGEDANLDGYGQDMTCKFKNQELGFVVGDEDAYLIGYLIDGTRFIGTEQVRVV